MIPRLFGCAAAALALSGCSGVRSDAADGVERFLNAARAGDPVSFEARIDRAALREDLRNQLTSYSQDSLLEVEGGPSERVLDRMIAPEALSLLQSEAGAILPPQPSPADVAQVLKPAGDGRVCIHDAASDGACLLTFARIDGRWRLVGLKTRDLRLDIESAPPPA